MGSRSLTFTRGLEEWELEVEFSLDEADPTVGLMSAYAMISKVSFYNANTQKWHPFALLPQEMDALEQDLNDDGDFDEDYYED